MEDITTEETTSKPPKKEKVVKKTVKKELYGEGENGISSADLVVVEIERKDGIAKIGFETVRQHVPIQLINTLTPIDKNSLEFTNGWKAIGYLEEGVGELIEF